MVVYLKTGERLAIEKIVSGGYIASRMGAFFLGGTPSRDLVGKYVIAVKYKDDSTGLIFQGEIKKIEDDKGQEIEFGNKNFPGHRDFNPLDSDAVNNPLDVVKNIPFKKKEKDEEGPGSFPDFSI